MRGKITVSQNFRGKNNGFQGQKWDSRILGILFGGKNSEFQGQFPSNILIENSCILFNQKITKNRGNCMI
ncbi:TPA: hypothetical protein NM638_000757 [Escherichia coli]|nr:hypothetical protein [Escherichia coli]